MIEEAQLSDLLSKYIKESWPAHSDVFRAFKVCDTEGVGLIKVTMLKRFLVQAQLDMDESVCEFITTSIMGLSLGQSMQITFINQLIQLPSFVTSYLLFAVERLIRDNCQIDS